MPFSGKIFIIRGAWLIGLGAYFILVRPAFLPEDPRYFGSSVESIRAVAPGLERWLGHVFRVLGGFMVATGASILLIAWHLLARRGRGAMMLMAVSGAAGVALMSGTNFLLQSDFKWPLLLPALLLADRTGLLWARTHAPRKCRLERDWRVVSRSTSGTSHRCKTFKLW